MESGGGSGEAGVCEVRGEEGMVGQGQADSGGQMKVEPDPEPLRRLIQQVSRPSVVINAANLESCVTSTVSPGDSAQGRPLETHILYHTH